MPKAALWKRVGRRIHAYWYWALVVVVWPALLVFVAGAAVFRFAAGDVLDGVVDALVLVAGGLLWRWAPQPIPNLALSRCWLELAELVDAHNDNQRLEVVDDQGQRQVFLLCVRRPKERGFSRVYESDVTHPQIDEPGYMPGDEFWLLPAGSRVLHRHVGALLDQDHVPYLPPNDPAVSAVPARGLLPFLDRTGSGYATVEQLRELTDLIHRATAIRK